MRPPHIIPTSMLSDDDDYDDDRPSMPPHPLATHIQRHWTLNGVQTAFVASPARFSFYVGGIGAGKTTAGAVRAALYASHHPGSLGLIGAPTYLMLRDTTQRAFLDMLPPEYIAAHHQTDGHLTLTNGAQILFRSLDSPDRVRGLNLAWFWLDEAPLASYYAWKILKGRLRQRGFPTAAWATGTPRGRNGFWLDFEGKPRPNHALFRASTHENLLNLPPGFIEQLGYSGAFALQEIEGLFVAFEGLVYTFDASPHPQGHLRDPQRGAHWSDVIGGIDWGYANPSTALVFALDGDGRAWQLDEFYQRRAGLEDVLLPAILDLTRRYGVRRWYCGPDEPEHITALAAALARDGLPAFALKADNAVRPGIQTVTALLAARPDGTRGLYVSPRCVHTIAEYGSYQYEPSPDPSLGVVVASGGRPEESSARAPSEHPLKQNDHAMDATRYALHTHFAQARATAAYLDALTRRLSSRGEADPASP